MQNTGIVQVSNVRTNGIVCVSHTPCYDMNVTTKTRLRFFLDLQHTFVHLSGTTNPRGTRKPDNPLKEIRNKIPRNPDNPLQGIRNLVPNRIRSQWSISSTLPTYNSHKLV